MKNKNVFVALFVCFLATGCAQKSIALDSYKEYLELTQSTIKDSEVVYINQQMNYYDDNDAVFNILSEVYFQPSSKNIFYICKKQIKGKNNVSFTDQNYYERRKIICSSDGIYEYANVEFYYSRYVNGKQLQSGNYFRTLINDEQKDLFLKDLFFDNESVNYITVTDPLGTYYSFFDKLFTNAFQTPFNSSTYYDNYPKCECFSTSSGQKYKKTFSLDSNDTSFIFSGSIEVFDKQTIKYLIDISEQKNKNKNYFFCLSTIQKRKTMPMFYPVGGYEKDDLVFNYI